MLADDINRLSGVEFENLCADLLSKIGFQVEITKASGDGGIDIVAYNHNPIYKGKYIIQCKRYSGSVGEPIIRDLYGVIMAERANKGILMTTGTFTKSAIEFAEGKQIELVDGDTMQSLFVRYNIGSVIMTMYANYPDIPDFGQMISRTPIDNLSKSNYFVYSASGLSHEILNTYEKMLVSNGFSFKFTFGDSSYYSNGIHIVNVAYDELFDPTFTVFVHDETETQEEQEESPHVLELFKMYQDYPDVPDFGEIVGAKPLNIYNAENGYLYNLSDKPLANAFINLYKELLEKSNFNFVGIFRELSVYSNRIHTVSIGYINELFTVIISNCD